MKILLGTYRKERYLPATLASIEQYVTGVDEIVFVDDSDDRDWQRELRKQGDVILPILGRGFASALDAATAEMRRCHNIDREVVKHFCWWEEDFVATAPIDLVYMQHILEHSPDLAQLALQRQPIFDEEKETGDLLDFLGGEPRWVGTPTYQFADPIHVQRRVFTTNPAVWARPAYDAPWPQEKGSEAIHTQGLLDRGYSFGYILGECVEHVAPLKEGTGY